MRCSIAMQTLHISTAVTEDYDWGAHLMTSTDPWITFKRDFAACRATLMRPGTDLFLARDDDSNQPLGFILLAPYGFAASPYIACFAVAANARGHGVGAQLLDFAGQRYHDRKHLFLLVSSFNRRAQDFYHRHGFNLVGELKDYIIAGHSELIFHKRLP